MTTVNKILNFAVAQFHCFQLYQSLVLLFIFPLIMSFSTYLYLFTFCCACLRIVGANTYCVVFLFCLSSSCVLCTLCRQFLWIVHFWLTLGVSLTFIVYDIIPNLKLQTGKVCALLQTIYLAICMLYLRII